MLLESVDHRVRHGSPPHARRPGRNRRRARWFIGALAVPLLLGACGGPLSALDPAGPAAVSTARLWWVMLVGASLVLGLVMVLVGLAFLQPAWMRRIPGDAYIRWGGLVLPAAVLTALLGYSLATGERQSADAREPGVLRMQAVARQWEWRFGPLDGPADADRLVIPAGRPVHVHVRSEDVIHSFWVPRLAGKIDAIPGHVNVIRILAPAPGVYHGACAEFCGDGHARMPFAVEAVAQGTEASR